MTVPQFYADGARLGRVALPLALSLGTLAALTSLASAQEFQLLDPNTRSYSIAQLSPTRLDITNNGVVATYDRAARHDAAGFTAYASVKLRKVIRWPNTNQGNFEIGEVSGLRMTYRTSQMQILPRRVVHRPVILPGHGGAGVLGTYTLAIGAQQGTAVVSANTLSLQFGAQQSIYRRDPGQDVVDYVAYSNPGLQQRVIRWPTNPRQPIYIGEVSGASLIYRQAVMKVVGGGPGINVGGGVGNGVGWRAETNLSGRPVVRSLQVCPAQQPVSIRVIAIAPGRSVGIGPVGGQAFDRIWNANQLAVGASLSYTPALATRLGIGVGTAAGYDAAVVAPAPGGGSRLTFDGGTILEVGGATASSWQRLASPSGGAVARSAGILQNGSQIRIHVVNSAPGRTIGIGRVGLNVLDKSWSSAQAPAGGSLVHIVPAAGQVDISVRSALGVEDVTITALPSATRLSFAGGTVIDVK